MNTEIKERLDKLAFKKSFPFCYGCYHRAPTGRCETCFSDDLMREMDGVGCEYGTEWIIEAILDEELTHADLSEGFEDSIRGSYPETTKVGWMEFDTVTLMKEMDPVSWRIAKSEYEDYEVEEGLVISFDGSTYFRCQDIEDLLDSEGV